MNPGETSRRTGRIAAAALMWGGAILGPVGAAHAEAARSTVPPSAGDSAVARGLSDDSLTNELTVDMQQMHLTNCATAVQRVMTFLIDGQPARFNVEPLGADSDRFPSVFVVESAAPNGGRTRLSTLMITANCSGMYEQMIDWTQPCDIIKSTVFAKFTGEHALLKDVHVSASGPAIKVYLTPAAGGGCVSVKKELFR